MRARLGDQLVVEGTRTGRIRRDGEIVGLHHADGTPPYDVRWSDTGRVCLVFPGPDAHVRHLEDKPRPGRRPVLSPRNVTAPGRSAAHDGDFR